jgi:DNA-binding protein HU-beta
MEHVNKAQLIEKVAASSGLTKKNAEIAVGAIFGSGDGNGVIVEAAAAGDTVVIVGFGSFSKAHRGARKGRNPQTGQEVQIAETNVPRFKPGNKYKDAVK